MKNDGKIYNCPRIELETETECGYSLPKIISGDVDQLEKPDNPEELYAAINKVGISRKNEFPVPDEVWDVSDVKKSLHKMKTSSLPNYGTSRQSGGYRTPSLPRRLGVKMGTRAIYSSLVQKDTALTDDMESLSLKSDTESSIQSLSARSTESPLPEAYVLNADIRTDDETFRVTEDESMSVSLAARLEELSFAEERILQTIKLERGHGGSIGLQVTEGNDGGVYVQAVSVGGSADMAGNVNKGDRIVAINGQNLLHLRYEDALKMLQSSSDTIELVLSQATSRKNATSRQNHEQPAENNYLNDIRFDMSSEADTSSMTNKWLVQRTTDVASVQNTSSAYSSAASSAMGNHNANSLYMADLVDNGALKSAKSASSTPPVPPRRKKRKAKPAAIARSPEGMSPTRLRKSDRKRLAPQPPPLPPRAIRRIRSHVARDQPEGTTLNAPTADDAEETLNSLSSSETGETQSSVQLEDADSVRNGRTSNDEDDSDDRCGPSRVTSSPQERPFLFETYARKETNKYPPLFFTLHDFQNVMSNTLQHEDDTDSKQEYASTIQDSFRKSFRNSFRKFFEKSLDDDENELCFRVTTTNLPFGKCLDRWSTTFADHFIENLEEPDRFIFEDYMDRSNKVNVRRSAGPMCYDSYEEEPTVPRLTKVRFVIESSRSPTPDHELDNDVVCDSLQSIDPPKKEEEVSWNRGSSVQLTDITDNTDCRDTSEVFGGGQGCKEEPDEFGDVPFSSILKTRNGSVEWCSLENATSFIETIDKGSEDDRVNSNNSSRDSTGFDSPDESFHSAWTLRKLKIADVSKAELSLIKSKTECRSVFAGIRDDCWNRPPEDNGFAWDTVPNNVEDNKESVDERDSTNETCEHVNNVTSSELISEAKNRIDDDIYELIRNKVNGNFIEQSPMIREEEWIQASEQKSTINKTNVCDEELITNEVESSLTKEHLVSNKIETKISETTSSAEGDEGIDEQQETEVRSFDKSTGEYRRKLFVNESLRNLTNHCDFLASDSDNQSQDSDVKDDNLATCDTPLNVDLRKSPHLTREDEEDEVPDIPMIPKLPPKTQSNFLDDEFLETKGNISVPVSIRRNSFLENMLSDDTDQTWTSCRIIAAHPKSSVTQEESKDRRENTLVTRLNESIKMDSEIQRILQESKESLKRIESTLPSSTIPKKVTETSKKSAGEVKCDVLNELLVNFSNIRLKPVNSEKRHILEDHIEVTISSHEKNGKEEIELRSDSHDRSFRVRNSDSSMETTKKTKETNETLHLNPKASMASQWQYAASLTTRKIQDQERNKCNESSEKPCVSSSISATTNIEPINFHETPKNREASSDRDEDMPETGLKRDEGTKNEDHSAPTRNVTKLHVEWTQRDAVEKVSDDVSSRGATESSLECLQKAVCSEKTDAKDESHNRGAIARQLDLSMRTGSGDKSAIARRISRPHCNNNDNNRAVTPVAVSDDQSRDTVTITPGRVRSFIKYYEIRREATTDKDSKTNDRVDRDRVPEHGSVYSIRRGLEARANEARSFDGQRKDNRHLPIADKDSRRSIGLTRMDVKSPTTVEKSRTEDSSELDDSVADGAADGRVEAKMALTHVSPAMSPSDSNTRPGKAKRKKSVKFQGGFTVIGARCPDENGSAGSPAGQTEDLIEEKRAPDRLTLKEHVLEQRVDFHSGQQEGLQADSRAFEHRETAAQIQAAAKCEDCSGINRFVPKPETPRLVFYCTV
ncbi:Tyrosine-protein phosphatase non-receptor type 13 [Eufriesea mexicana]|uniref:Tyrosine-protein phosphatase non-receptor type 13 n=1 Tax=Eufriesea mexicana TaxID=516756 RepID=A0A310SGM3_9HYME|nr:Tyrosine-protein phosphatase non-receptor type 13 [Eufriesea mexicana]